MIILRTVSWDTEDSISHSGKEQNCRKNAGEKKQLRILLSTEVDSSHIVQSI